MITVIVDNKSIIGDEYAPGGFSALIENELDDGSLKNAGVPDLKEMELIEDSGRVIKSKDVYYLTHNIWITGEILNSMLKKVITRKNGVEKPALIKDDISLVIEIEDHSKIVICGCCH